MPGQPAALQTLGQEHVRGVTTWRLERDSGLSAVPQTAWLAAERQTDDSSAEVASQTVLHQAAVDERKGAVECPVDPANV